MVYKSNTINVNVLIYKYGKMFVKFSKSQYPLFTNAVIPCSRNEFEGNVYLIFSPFNTICH